MQIIEKADYSVSELPSAIVTSLLSTEMFIAYIFAGLLMGLTFVKRGPSSLPKDKTIKGVLASVAIFACNILLAPILTVGVYYTTKFYELANIPSLSGDIWIGTPVFAAAVIAIISKDFVDYWNHRIMHTKWVWPIHAIHHSDEVVNGMTTFRIHALEALFMKMSHILVLSWMGMPPEAAASSYVLLMLLNMYVHADVDWNHGRFKLLVASPQFHRWHHADYHEAYGKNLANVIPLYDYLFGTYYDPGPCRERMGAKGVPHADVVGLMAFPFVEWGKLVSETGLGRFFRGTSDNQPAMDAVVENPLTPVRRSASSNN